MLATPDLSHLTETDYHSVYEPAEDTFLLLDALETDASRLEGARITLEIGSGSGCVSTFLHQILGAQVLHLCTDINEHATACTTRTAQRNKVHISAILCDLASPLVRRLKGIVDVLIFNPPYVPTDQTETHEAVQGRGIEGSWAGGSNGMLITNRLLPYVEELLSARGYFYLVAVKSNDVPVIIETMERRYTLHGEVRDLGRYGIDTDLS